MATASSLGVKWRVLEDSRSVGFLVLALALGGCVRLLQPDPEPVADRSGPDRPGSDAAAPDRSIADRSGPDQDGGQVPDAKKPDAPGLDAKPPDLKKLDGKKPDGPKPDTKVLTVPGIWVYSPAGTFMMGSPLSEGCKGANEIQHQVTLSAKIRIQTTEVTQGQFLDVRGYNPSYFTSCGGTCPVETVSWNEAAAYCNGLSDREGVTKCYTCSGSGTAVSCSEASPYGGSSVYTCPGYRLPTEAEWEKAYRAGTTTGYYNAAVNPTMCGACTPMDPNVGAIAWQCGNAGSSTHPVGQKASNQLGLFDMAGNVREWCHDWYKSDLIGVMTDPWGASPVGSTTRVARGGAYGTNAADVRAAAREHYPPTDRAAGLGFRCVRTN